MADTIRNPIEWSWDQLRAVGQGFRSVGEAARHIEDRLHQPVPAVRRIGIAELGRVLARGAADFGACRTDVLFLCAVYPIAGLVLGRAVYGQDLLPLLFPIAAGFAILGPAASIGMYQLSRLRERQAEGIGWSAAFGVLRSPAIGAIGLLALYLVGLFLLWLGAAWLVYAATLGPEPPADAGAFLGDVFGTAAGWTMIVVGCGVGFLFALAAMAISLVSFPLLLDRDVGLDTAVRTSLRVMRVNPLPMAAWGLIVAGLLVLGSIPLLLGLIVVLPLLGHATWHLYRAVVLPSSGG
ncbi:DUF2189 domain-containing protein [Marinibaculum pumilum]|uniref:DUF2189 domain-containing protein n=1 Tax=Marinibaculum pumilum TaxID=1766165 RepID=A0ABV7L3S1_9PROT